MRLFQPKRAESSGGLSRQEALQCIPVIHSSVDSSVSDSGEILLEYPLQVKPFFLALFRRFQDTDEIPTKKLQLDELGSQVWKNIDGKNSTQEIISTFATDYGITAEEAEQSVTAFLVELGKRGIIAMR